MITLSKPAFTGIVIAAKKEGDDKEKLDTLMQDKHVKDSFNLLVSRLCDDAIFEAKFQDDIELEQSLEDKLKLKLKVLGFKIKQIWDVTGNECRNR